MVRPRTLSQYLLYGILFALPFERIPSWHITLSGTEVTLRISQILALLLIIINIPRLWNKRSQLLKIPWLFLLLFNIASLMSALLSLHVKRGLMVFMFVSFVSVLSWTIANVFDRAKISAYLKFLFAGAFLAIAIGIYQFFGDLMGLSTGVTFLRDQYTKVVFGFPRIQSTALEPLYFANYLLIPLSICAFYLVFRARSWWIRIIPIIASITLTLSRGAYLGSAVIIFFASAASVYRKKTARLGLLLASVVVGVATAVTLISLAANIDTSRQTDSHKNVSNLTHQTANINNGESSTGRARTRSIAADAWLQYPVLGIGPGEFGYFANNKDPVFFAEPKAIVNNEPLEILAEEGALGMILLVSFLSSVVITAYKELRSKTQLNKPFVAALLVALAGVCAQYLTFSTLYIAHIWVAIGLLIGSTQTTNRIKDEYRA